MKDTTGNCEHGVPYREVCEACREEAFIKILERAESQLSTIEEDWSSFSRMVVPPNSVLEALLARLQSAVNIYGGHNQPPGGAIIVTKTKQGEIVKITRNAEDGQVLETIWSAK